MPMLQRHMPFAAEGRGVTRLLQLSGKTRLIRMQEGVGLPFSSAGGLYFSTPLAASATPLVVGALPGRAPEPVAWTNRFGKSRIFYTSLGQEEEFAQPAFQKLLENAMEWLRVLPSDLPNAEGF